MAELLGKVVKNKTVMMLQLMAKLSNVPIPESTIKLWYSGIPLSEDNTDLIKSYDTDLRKKLHDLVVFYIIVNINLYIQDQ